MAFYRPQDEQEALEHFKRKIGQIVGALLAHLSQRHPRKYGLLRHKTVPAAILKNNDYFEAIIPTLTYPPLIDLVKKLGNVVASSLDVYAPLPEVILSEGFGPSVTGTEPHRFPVMGISKDEMKALIEQRKKLAEKYGFLKEEGEEKEGSEASEGSNEGASQNENKEEK